MYTVYNKETGQITGWCSGMSQDLCSASGELYSGKLDSATQYIVEGQPQARPDMNPVVIQNGNTWLISELPLQTTLIIEGVKYEVTDGEIELSFSYPGSYQCLLQSFPYRDLEVILENTAQ